MMVNRNLSFPLHLEFFVLEAFQFVHGEVETSGVRRHDSKTALFNEDSSL